MNITTITISILQYLFLFITGAMIGWVIELFFRRYFGNDRKWINPGFLSGPYLPLYGFGTCILYIVSDLPIDLGWKILCFAVATTLIELVTGIIFLRYYRIRLWDYSNNFLNYKGHICPLFTFFWTVLSLIFYFLLYPYFYGKIEYLYEHLEFSLFIGIVYGVIIVDVSNSFDIANKVKHFIENAEHSEQAIVFDKLKEHSRQRLEDMKSKVAKPNFILPFKNFDIKNYLPIKKEDRNDENVHTA